MVCETEPDWAPVKVTWWLPAEVPVGRSQVKLTEPLASAAFVPMV